MLHIDELSKYIVKKRGIYYETDVVLILFRGSMLMILQSYD